MKKDRITREKEMFPKMALIYCHDNHGTKGKELCPACQELCDYALNRLDHCRWGNDKTFCSQCPCHCYRPDMRERVRELMRYTGPRLMLYHPLLCLLHGLGSLWGLLKKKLGIKNTGPRKARAKAKAKAKERGKDSRTEA
ncbi:MAG TPA: nitrous oxide-stimulated promoter family protein [Clostridiales bacterium]|nr:nitrous oxide-stimulated promoter family protein [Clostridiales bacterium]